MTNCPNCGAPYQLGATACRYCGTARQRQELPELLQLEHFVPAGKRPCDQVSTEQMMETATRGCQNVSTQTAINLLLCNVATKNEARAMCGLFNPMDKRMG